MQYPPAAFVVLAIILAVISTYYIIIVGNILIPLAAISGIIVVGFLFLIYQIFQTLNRIERKMD